MHAHSDLALLTEPEHLAKVSQGVTLEVLGQDGLSYAPVDDTTRDDIRRQITLSKIGYDLSGDQAELTASNTLSGLRPSSASTFIKPIMPAFAAP